MKDLLKKMIKGTALEAPARWIHSAFASTHGRSMATINAVYDAQTIEVMESVLKQSSNCVDVGCHTGSILQHMLRLAPEGTHFAFEPIPNLYQVLRVKFG